MHSQSVDSWLEAVAHAILGELLSPERKRDELLFHACV